MKTDVGMSISNVYHILTHILVCILFVPPSLLFFIFFKLFFTLVYVYFYHDYTFHYRQLSRGFCMTMCTCVYSMYTQLYQEYLYCKPAYNKKYCSVDLLGVSLLLISVQ